MMEPHLIAELIRRARLARAQAHAPYSQFQVGAAVLTEKGIYAGANIENASFGLTVCAERTAVLRAVFEGARELRAIAIASPKTAPPCGMCLQTLTEFCGEPEKLLVILTGLQGAERRLTLVEMLPHPFRL